MRLANLWFAALCGVVCSVGVRAGNFSAVDRLYTDLMTNYNKNIRPVANFEDTIFVSLGITVTHLRMDVKEGVVNMNSYFRMSWTDERLRWNASDYASDGKLDEIRINDDQIWKPDITLYNDFEYGKDFGKFSNIKVVVHSNGEVLYVPAVRLRAICNPSMRYWPLEKQTCLFKLGSWAHNGFQIDLKLYENSTKVHQGFFMPRAVWKLVDSSLTVNTSFYMCCPEPYIAMDADLTLQRASAMYTYTIFIPAIVIACLTLNTFLLPPKSNGKIITGLINLLILCMYLIYFNVTIEASDDEVPLIVSFYGISVILIGFSVSLAIFTAKWASKSKSASPPAIVMKLVSLISGVPGFNLSNKPTEDSSQSQLGLKTEVSSEDSWFALAVTADRLALLVYVVTFLALLIQLFCQP